jgi:hypothetical protein
MSNNNMANKGIVYIEDSSPLCVEMKELTSALDILIEVTEKPSKKYVHVS